MFVDEGIKTEPREFATVAGIFHAAERKFETSSKAGIYAGHARFNFFADFGACSKFEEKIVLPSP